MPGLRIAQAQRSRGGRARYARLLTPCANIALNTMVKRLYGFVPVVSRQNRKEARVNNRNLFLLAAVIAVVIVLALMSRTQGPTLPPAITPPALPPAAPPTPQ